MLFDPASPVESTASLLELGEVETWIFRARCVDHTERLISPPPMTLSLRISPLACTPCMCCSYGSPLAVCVLTARLCVALMEVVGWMEGCPGQEARTTLSAQRGCERKRQLIELSCFSSTRCVWSDMQEIAFFFLFFSRLRRLRQRQL